MFVDIKFLLLIAVAFALSNSNEGSDNVVNTIATPTDQESSSNGPTESESGQPSSTEETSTSVPATTPSPPKPPLWMLVVDSTLDHLEGVVPGGKAGKDPMPDPMIPGNGELFVLNLTEVAGDPIKSVSRFCEAIEKWKPEIVLDYTQISIPSEAVKVTTRALKIPTVAISTGSPDNLKAWQNLDSDEEQYLILIMSSTYSALRVARKIVTSLELKSVAIFYGHSLKHLEGFPAMYKSVLQDTGCRNKFIRISSSPNRIIQQIEETDIKYFKTFYVIGEDKEVCMFLEAAAETFELETSKVLVMANASSLFYITKDKDFKCSVLPVGNVGHIYPKIPGTTEESLAAQLRHDVKQIVVAAAAKLKMLDKWTERPQLTCYNFDLENRTDLVFSLGLREALKDRSSDSSLKLKANLVFNGNGENAFAITYALDHHNVGPEQSYVKASFKAERVAEFDWNSDGSLVTVHEGGKSLQNLKPHVVYRVVTVVQPPLVYHKKGCKLKHEYDNCYSGYFIDLLNLLRDEIGFNYTIFDVPNYGFRQPDPPYPFDGMVKVLQDNEADFAVGAISIMVEREEAIDFTYPVYDLVGFQFLMKKDRVRTSLHKFLTVLENDVWMCVLGAFFFTSGLLWLFDRWSPYSLQNCREKYEDDEEQREFTLKESLWFCMTSLTPQGGGEAPKNLSGRLVAATWWLFGFIIVASYTANLAAFLTVSRLEQPVDSLELLRRQYKVQYGPIENSSAWHYFDRMADIEHKFYQKWRDMSLNDSLTEYERSKLAVWEYPVSDSYTKIWQAILENQAPPNVSEAVRRLTSIEATFNDDPNIPDQQIDEFAWITEATEIKYHFMTHCAFRIVGKEFAQKPYAWMVQKGSPLKRILSDGLRSLESRRYFDDLKTKWWDHNREKKRCKAADKLKEGILAGDIGGVFIIIIIGIGSTILASLMEFWWYKRHLEVDDISIADTSSITSDVSAAYTNQDKTDYTSPFVART